MFSKIKTKYLWISVAICFLLAAGLIIGVTFLQEPWTTVVIVILAIVFIYMTVAIQVASTRSFKYKPKKQNYITKEFTLKSDDIAKTRRIFMKKIAGEFKKFIMRGNVVDMAVGVIVGGAFTAVVNGLSNFVLKPIINGFS